MTSPLYLLDTSIILHLARGRELGRYLRTVFELDSLILRPLISIVSHGEMWVLADRNNWGAQKRAECGRILQSLVTEDLGDQSILDTYVELSRAAQKNPGGARELGDNDLWIAATAKAAQAVLLTTDKDFRIFHPDYLTVTYIDPAQFRAGGARPQKP